jgi:ribosome maturation factor RimP
LDVHPKPVSRALKRWLDEAGVSDTYRLEVSSPGVDRPLRRLADWERFLGRPVDIVVPALAGRFRVRPLAVHADPEPTVVCDFPRLGRRELRLSDIKEARLGFDW